VRAAYADLRAEAVAAVDGLGPYRRLMLAGEEPLYEKGALVLRYRGATFEASRTELLGLLFELEEAAERVSAEGRRARAA
jgi:hypothetical protein